MSTYIMTINNKAKISPKEIEKHRKNYVNGQDGFIVAYTDEDLGSRGFVIKRDDNLVTKYVEMKKVKIDDDIKAQITKEKKIIKQGGISSKDTSVTKGEKPYEPNKDKLK